MASCDEIAIGIDLGTTFSTVAYLDDDRIEIIENKFTGSRLTPSCVTFSETDLRIGKQNRISENSVFEVKRIIGLDFDDKNVQLDIEKWPFSVINEDAKPKIQVEYKNKLETFYPEQISAMVLFEMKRIASSHLNQEVKKAVITVPAYFNDSQRQATKDAGKIAGLDVIRIINEPTAAAIAYGYHKKMYKRSKVLIFDLGGGTFDVSIMEICKGEFQVIGIGGDTHLGGVDFDNRLLNYFADLLNKKYNCNIRHSKKAMQRLKAKCEEIKRELSQVNETRIEIDSLYNGHDFIESITRLKFEELNQDLFEKSIEITKQTLNKCNMNCNDIDDIVLVGGSTRIPKILTLLEELFVDKTIHRSINPDEAVAYGAAIQAALPVKFTTSRVKNIVDVIPKSIGIELLDGSMGFYFQKFTSIPNKLVKEWSTSNDNQTALRFSIYEGEEKEAKKNTFLGQFILKNIKLDKAGVPKIDCSFELDINGILHVTAKDKDTLSTNKITITKINSSLNEDQINNMVENLKSLFKK